MVNARTDVEALSALLDDELSPAEREAVQARLAREPALAREHAWLSAVDDAIGRLPAPPACPDYAARVLASVQPDAPAVRARIGPRRTAWRWAAGLAGLAAAAAIVVLLRPAPVAAGDDPARSPEAVQIASDLGISLEEQAKLVAQLDLVLDRVAEREAEVANLDTIVALEDELLRSMAGKE